jgi:DNA repair protein RadC
MGTAELVSLVAGLSEARAVDLIDQVGGLTGLVRAGTGELAEIVGVARAVRLRAALELGARALEEASRSDRPQFPDARTVFSWARPRLVHLDHEELWVLALDGRHGLRAARLVARGGLHGLHVAPRDILRVAVRDGASAIVLVHNHPSGDPRPSDEDIMFTKHVARVAREVGTPLLDHVIVARGGHTSLLDEGVVAAA